MFLSGNKLTYMPSLAGRMGDHLLIATHLIPYVFYADDFVALITTKLYANASPGLMGNH
jgi:hypothetical protein